MRSEIKTKLIFDLPQDVIEEIFSKVPVTCLRRLRSTCKRLHALLKDRGFIKKYYDTRQYHALMLLNFKVYSMSYNLHGVSMDVVPKGELSLIDPYRNNTNADISQVFHCDGLLLCTTRENRLVVWNPFTGQKRWLQQQNRDRIDDNYILGYDNSYLCHSYKILRVPDIYYQKLETSQNSRRNLDVTPKGDLELKVDGISSNSRRRYLGVTTPRKDLELKLNDFSSNSWKNLDVITPKGCLKSYGVSLKGNAYWVYLSKQRGVNDYSLLSFDFATECFQHLCVPFHQEADCFDTTILSVGKGEHLSLLYQSCETLKVEIWITNKIETTFVSWRKFLKVDIETQLPMFSCRMSFFIEEEMKVAVCCDRNNKVYIVREDEYKVSSGFNFLEFEGVRCCLTLFGYVPRLV